MAGLNKKILCFIDEFGTAGNESFGFGAVFVWAGECGQADRVFTGLLPNNANEVHASQWKSGSLQSILDQYGRHSVSKRLVMINKSGEAMSGTRPEIYAKVLIETVKVGLKHFGKLHQVAKMGNVEVITDANHQNEHADFKRLIDHAQDADGRFKAVASVTRLDSAASRMLQLADVVAYSRTWIHSCGENAKSVYEKYGIALL